MSECRDKVIEAVRADLLRRSELGIVKYNTTLSESKAEMKERLQHAYEEALDLANYLKWSIFRIESEEADVAKRIEAVAAATVHHYDFERRVWRSGKQ